MRLSNFSRKVLLGHVKFLLFTLLICFFVLFACIYSVYTASDNSLQFEISLTLLIGMKALSFMFFIIMALLVFMLDKNQESFIGIVIFWTFISIALLLIFYLPFSFLWKKLLREDGFARFVLLFSVVLIILNIIQFVLHCVFVFSSFFYKKNN